MNSHHSGVPEAVFLVKVDGLTIYHNGDYVGRMGDYETAPSNVPADMNYLKTKLKSLDILFLDAYVDECPIQILQNLKPQVLSPCTMEAGRENTGSSPVISKQASISRSSVPPIREIGSNTGTGRSGPDRVL